MRKYILLLVLFTLILSPVIVAQDDSTKIEKDWKWHWNWNDWEDWNDWEVDFGFKETRPAISLQYGVADINRKNLQSQFVDPNLFELKLGRIKENKEWSADYIVKHSYKFIYLSNTSNKISGKDAVGSEVETDMWRFGFGRSSGYGYSIGESAAIIPYYTYTMNWSRIDFNIPDDETINIFNLFSRVPEYDILKLYDESFRFGTSSEGGVRIKIIDNLMFDAGYERSIVFQRHLFWKWAGSALIEMVSQGLLDGFISEIFESTPAAGPIVNFVLKSALAYGIYELRQDKMNWPFSSEAPIAYDQVKFGLTFVF